MKYDYYDLIIVGTGFSSTFFLKKYLEKNKGVKRILVLERGQLFPHSERLKIKRGELADSPASGNSWEDQIMNKTPEKRWPFTTAFGGSSNCWWGCTPRFMPSDFKMKTLFGVENDWPVTYEELDPYYEEAEELMAISGPEGTPFPKKSKYPLPAHNFSPIDKILHQKYGNQYISQPTARASRGTKGRNQCMANSSCDVCPVDAKFTIENSGIDVYQNAQVELLYGAQVYRLETAGNIAKKVCYVKDGKDYEIAGEVIVLGANPMFNSNILLNSGDRNPLTGKGFGEQLGMQVLIYLDNLKNTGGSTWVNANGYMLYDGNHRKDYAACLIETNNAPYNIRLERGKWLNMTSFRMIFEDLPLLTNYITTTSDKLVPEINFKGGRSDYALKGMENMKKVLPGILSCLPVEKLKFLDPFPNEGHILGGTRMGKTAADSVVDKNMVHHQYRNVFVLGSGSFTTFSASNPTLTLSAMSLYSADHSF